MPDVPGSRDAAVDERIDGVPPVFVNELAKFWREIVDTGHPRLAFMRQILTACPACAFAASLASAANFVEYLGHDVTSHGMSDAGSIRTVD